MITRALRMELFKLSRRPVRGLLFLILLVCFKAVVLLTGSGEETQQEGSAYVFLARSAAITVNVWWFLFLCLAAASLSNENSRGILRMHLPRPISRGSYFLARVSAFLATTFLLLLADAAAGTALAALFRDFGDVADPALQGPQFAASAMAMGVLRGYLLTYLGMAATLSLGFLISVLCTSATAAVAWAAGTGLVLEGVRLTLTQNDVLRLYLINWYNHIHFDRLVKLARGIADFTPSGFYLMSVVIPLAFFVVLIFLSLKILKKSDIVG